MTFDVYFFALWSAWQWVEEPEEEQEETVTFWIGEWKQPRVGTAAFQDRLQDTREAADEVGAHYRCRR